MGWADPTVYVPYQVRVELARPVTEVAGRTVEWAADNVMLTPAFVFLRDPAGRSLSIPLDAVRSLRVEVCDRPPDYDQVRQRYPHAYDIWDDRAIQDIRYAGMGHRRRPWTLGDLAERTGRPPDHLAGKARELGYEIADGPATGNATRDDRYRTDDYLVYVGALGRPPPKPAEVLARHDIIVDNVYRIGGWGFAARLHRHRAERLEADPDVTKVQPDPERLAPHHRMPPGERVPDSYIVSVRRTSHPTTVATRAGIAPTNVFTAALNAFAATLTSTQLDTLRHDPEVTHIDDDCIVRLT